MYKRLLFSILIVVMAITSTNAQDTENSDSIVIRQIYDQILSNGAAYDWLDDLVNGIGGRLSGSPEAAAAVEWARQVMDTLGFDSVWLQPVMVPHWVRGDKEVARVLSPDLAGTIDVNVLALGGSIGTGNAGITAPVVEVRSFDELQKLGKRNVKGRIVFFNVPMDPTNINTFQSYSQTVGYRSRGAIEAARLGAVASVVRSVTLKLHEHPHTGGMRYEQGVPQIPGVAISTLHADQLSQLLRDDKNLKLHLRTTSHTLPDKLSYNVIGEIRGSQIPEEIILAGSHLDSWDITPGAHDAGAGCVQSMQVMKTFHTLGIRPKRTFRVVLFMNEENGTRGARAYAEHAASISEKHIAAIESDAGGFTPRGFGINGEPEVIEQIRQYKDLFEPYNLHIISRGFGGVDVNFLKPLGTVPIGLYIDTQRYFDIHHAVTDTFETVNQRELELGAAAMASLVYLLTEYGLE